MRAKTPHLLVAITAHGYGHTTQTAPVINALRERIPTLRVTVRTTVPRALLAARIAGTFAQMPVATDFGMVMASAVEVRAEASAAAYTEFHRDWPRRVNDEAAALAALAPDLVLCNVPYLTLAGAALAGIPAVALCSLNWADIYRHYCGHRPDADEIHAQILAAYNSAACFLQTEPSMPMVDIAHRRAIGPVARVGLDRRAELRKRIDATETTRVILIAPGGMPLRLPMEDWPRTPGLRWLVPAEWKANHPDAVALESLGLHFIDILRSCDALVGKPGYGSFAEAACNGVPVLYVSRGDWPEEPHLIRWLARHGRCAEIARTQLPRGEIHDDLERLFAVPAPSVVAPSGIAEAAEYLATTWLDRAAAHGVAVPGIR